MKTKRNRDKLSGGRVTTQECEDTTGSFPRIQGDRN